MEIRDFLFGVMVASMIEHNQKLHLIDYGDHTNYVNGIPDGSRNLGFKIVHERDLDSEDQLVYIYLNSKELLANINYVVYRDSRGYDYRTTKAHGLDDIAIELEEKIILAVSKMDSRW